MPSFSYVTVDVFTDTRFGGNQLAVFPDASKLPPELMGRIAREFNFSETTFVLPPSDSKHTRRVRIFTPTSELPFAGHPTVGTAFALASLGEIPLHGAETHIVFEEGVGPVPVVIRATNGKPGFAQLTAARLPEIGPPPPAARDLAAVVGLDEADILTGRYGPEAVSCGVCFLMVPVRDRRVLARAHPRAEEFQRVFRGYVTNMVFLFCDDPEQSGSHYRARMFAPEVGVQEDPATGSAGAAFAGYLAARDERADGTLRWVVEQGFEMGRPSILEIEADKRAGAVSAIRVGGNSVLVSRGELFV
jgi:trans-2,3-dihydro-3-hydroxyanthranilate isomerase